MWMGAMVDIHQHFIEMPKWFANAPAAFHLIGKQSRKAKSFWVPLTLLVLLTVTISIILNWYTPSIRNYLIASTACFMLAGIISVTYFAKQVITFTKINSEELLTPELYYRMKLWFYNTTARDVLQLMAVVFVTIAFLHIY